VAHRTRAEGATVAKATESDAVLVGDTQVIPTLTVQAAGMQGAATQGLAYAGNTGSLSFGFGGSSRPGYYVEGASADEGAHDGFSGGSQGGSKGQSDSEGQEKQQQGQSDAYVA